MPALSDYVAKPHVIRTHGKVEVPEKARLKLYSLCPNDHSSDNRFGQDELEVLADEVAEEIKAMRIDAREGLGFAIVSPGVVSVNLWGGEYPSLLNPVVYSFNREELDNVVTLGKSDKFGIHRRSIEQSGAYCCWEGTIVGHESAAWQRFLASPRGKVEEDRYLGDVCTGIIR